MRLTTEEQLLQFIPEIQLQPLSKNINGPLGGKAVVKRFKKCVRMTMGDNMCRKSITQMCC